MTLLAFIPARGGSKGIPKKNLISLAGKPLIQYTIETAQKSRWINDILVSTDDEEIFDFCLSLGLKMNYRRPVALAGDETSMIDTLEHGLFWFEQNEGRLVDEILLLQPTSPLRSAQDIDNAVERFRESGARSLVSVHAMAEHPCECVIDKGGDSWEYLVSPSDSVVRRQDYAHDYYFINGAIYLADPQTLLSQRSFVNFQNTVIYVMPRERGLDIDTPLDLMLAEVLLYQQRGR